MLPKQTNIMDSEEFYKLKSKIPTEETDSLELPNKKVQTLMALL